MLMIRLQRIGRRHDPSYKVVVIEKASGPRAGRNVEELGHYDARLRPGSGPLRSEASEAKPDFVIKTDRVKYWLSVGAQASGTVHNLLVREGITTGPKKDVRPSKTIQTIQTKQTEQTAQTITEEPKVQNEENKEEVKEEVATATA